MKNNLIKVSAVFAFIILLGAGCQTTNKPTLPEANINKNTVTPIANMPNPASTNCVQKGGRLEIRNNKLGQYGVCLFEDNRQCEEWALMRGDCPKGGLKITGYGSDAEIYCAITGGTVEGVGTKTPMCKRIDGTRCTVEANIDGDCPDPRDPNPSAGNKETK